MRLLIAAPIYPPDPGGPATYAKALEEGLPAHGIKIDLVKFGDVRGLPKLLRHIAYFWNVYATAKDADAVLALDPASTGFPAACAALLRRKPFFVKIVGDYAWEQGTQRSGIQATPDEFVRMRQVPLFVAFLRVIETLVARRAKRIIVPSEYLKRIISAWGIPSEKITVIYNAVSPETAGQVSPQVTALGHPLIVSVGRLVPWKGMVGLIDAVAAARATTPELSLAIVGDGPERELLEAHAAKMLKTGYVFTRTIPHADVLATIASADAFALNTSYEGFSHLIIEALSLGIPVVTTPVGGNTEVIETGTNGMLAPVDDRVTLAKVLVQVTSDRALHARLSEHAKKSADQFTLATLMRQTSDFFHTHI